MKYTLHLKTDNKQKVPKEEHEIRVFSEAAKETRAVVMMQIYTRLLAVGKEKK